MLSFFCLILLFIRRGGVCSVYGLFQIYFIRLHNVREGISHYYFLFLRINAELKQSTHYCELENVILSTFLPVPWITRFKTKDLSNPLITIQITNTSQGRTPCQQ